MTPPIACPDRGSLASEKRTFSEVRVDWFTDADLTVRRFGPRFELLAVHRPSSAPPLPASTLTLVGVLAENLATLAACRMHRPRRAVAWAGWGHAGGWLIVPTPVAVAVADIAGQALAGEPAALEAVAFPVAVAVGPLRLARLSIRQRCLLARDHVYDDVVAALSTFASCSHQAADQRFHGPRGTGNPTVQPGGQP